MASVSTRSARERQRRSMKQLTKNSMAEDEAEELLLKM
jgi:hypothetical protein